MHAFKYHRPSSVNDAAALVKGEAKLLAGGQTLVQTMKLRLASPSDIIDLGTIKDLAGIKSDGKTLSIGAMTRHADVAHSAEVKKAIPALAALAAMIGDRQVRAMGTIGGSVANNDPAADYPAGCLGLGATIVTNLRTVSADEFFTGFFSTALAPAEVITSIRFPVPMRAAYVKFANQASRYATVGVFISQSANAVRVAVTGAGRSGVFRAGEMEQALAKDFRPETLPAHCVALDDLNTDLHASAEYRSHLINVLARRAVEACMGAPSRHPVRHGGAYAF